MGSQANQALPAGSRLENYRIVRTLASGGGSLLLLPARAGRFPLRLPRARRERRAGGDQGISAGDTGGAHRPLGLAYHRARRCRPFQLRPEMLFRGRPRARRAAASERGARAQFLPRQRYGVPGDALRARPLARNAYPPPAGIARRSLAALDLRATAERTARSAFEQAPASRYQAGECLSAR